MKKFIQFMEDKFVPLANKISNNLYLKTISNGSMNLLGIIMLGSLFTVITSIAWEPYQNFLASTWIGTLLSYVPDFTIDLLALYMAFSVAYNGAKIFGIEKSALNSGLISVVSFLLLTPLNTTALEGATFLDVSYLGAKGVFAALIVAVITVKVMQFFVTRNIVIKMPEGVPTRVTESFTSLIPAVVIVLLFGLAKIGFAATEYETANGFIYTILQAPLQSLTGSLPAFLCLILIAQLLWFFCIHGSMTVLPILFPIFLGYLAENTAAVEAGLTAPNPINFGLYDLACLGGCGATIGLVIVMFFFSKSKRYKAFSKVVLPCGLFSVNEPVIFGMPLMLNVMMLIPFLITPVIIVSLGYFLIQIGIITPTIGVLGAGSLPPVIHGIVQGSLSFGIFEIFATIISMAIYYPFFKVLDNQALKEEMDEIAE
ncbi:PTS sugar transporter subunit IIC [Clostridium sp.]|uniref:PTS sugar transporter subunit IIC n=1 Tax=Clostridium sp. TaxID=1506 RepID=UPI002902F2C0|nr:PTS transporter subunit EIIC [Clostridium sp.]MDU1034266.1 PTS transporter subunit EIIC [Clostridium sp.]